MSGTNLANPGNVTPAQFKADFPMFADGTLYPESSCQMYLNLANTVLDPGRFGDYINMAIELYTAHFLTLDAMDIKSARAGGILGQQGGQVSGKGVGQAHTEYETSGAIEPGGGHWNQTNYGKRYYRLCMMAGMGGVQVTGAQLPDGSPFPGVSA